MLASLEDKLRALVVERLSSDPAHDLSHIERVVCMARAIGQTEEGTNFEVLIPAAWLHDIVSFPKNSEKRSSASREAARFAVRFLEDCGISCTLIPKVVHAIEAHSYSANIQPQTLEAQILRDADRLDALGAHGLARCLQVGTQLGLELYDAKDPFATSRELNDKLFSIDHFKTKLFKLEQGLFTDEAKKIAQERVSFLRSFLIQLEKEMIVRDAQA